MALNLPSSGLALWVLGLELCTSRSSHATIPSHSISFSCPNSSQSGLSSCARLSFTLTPWSVIPSCGVCSLRSTGRSFTVLTVRTPRSMVRVFLWGSPNWEFLGHQGCAELCWTTVFSVTWHTLPPILPQTQLLCWRLFLLSQPKGQRFLFPLYIQGSNLGGRVGTDSCALALHAPPSLSAVLRPQNIPSSTLQNSLAFLGLQEPAPEVGRRGCHTC